MAKQRDLMPTMAQRLDLTHRANPTPCIDLPLSSYNLSSTHPQKLWDRYSNQPPVCTHVPSAPSLPIQKRRKTMDCNTLCHVTAFLLILLALLGAGLGMYKIFQLRQALSVLKQVTNVEITTAMEKQIGDWKAGKKGNNCAAHLTGNNNIRSLPLKWDSSTWGTFIAGVRYRDGGLVIEKNGLYFIYSKVYFRGEGCSFKYLKHMVFRQTLRYPQDQVLMEGRTMSNCESSSNTWSRSSYLGAVFNLTRADSLYVNVSEVAFVGFDAAKTFFGLFKL